jgi:integrase
MARRLSIGRTARKRPNGSGSIYREKDGRYRVKVYFDGRAYRGSARTMDDALRVQDELLRRKRMGMGLPVSVSVSEYAAEWLESTERRGVRSSTLRRYRQHAAHIVRIIGGVNLSSLTPRRIELLYAELLDGGLSTNTVAGTHRALRAMLRRAFRQGVLHHDVMARVESPSITIRVMPITSIADAQRIFRQADLDQRFGPLWETLLSTGMRISEALDLMWDHVDLEARTVWVGESKTRSGVRLIRIEGDLAVTLRSVRARQEGNNEVGGGYVFRSATGGRLRYDHVYHRAWRPFVKEAGLPGNTRMHDLRHLAGSLMLRHANLAEVSRTLGHASPMITAAIYMHALTEDIGATADAMSDVRRTMAG